MNQNRPFFSTNTNLYDESFRSSAPATFNGQNVILSQEQQRRIYDTLNTAIVGNSFGLNNISPGNVRVLHAQKQFFPGGVTFTFNQQQSQPQQMTPDMCCKCPASNATTFDNTFHAGANTFFPSTLENTLPSNRMSRGLDCLNYQQLASRNPFQLKFHADHSTSSSDLLCHFTPIPASKGFPDFQQNQVDSNNFPMPSIAQEFFSLPQVEFSSNAKKLVLSKNVSICGHVVDVLEENEKNEINKKRVSFSDDHSDSPARSEKSSQITSDCVCNAKECENGYQKPKKKENESSTDKENKKENTKKKKKEKKKRKDNASSCDATESSDSEHNTDSERPKRFRWWNKHKNEKTYLINASDTDEEKSEPNGKEGEKNKKRKNNLSDNIPNPNLSDSSDQQSSTSEHSRSEET